MQYNTHINTRKVTTIGNEAFEECSSLTSISLNNEFKEIGTRAFYKCDSLTEITVPDSATSIGENAFYGVSKVIYSGPAEGSPWGALQHVTE